MKKIYKIIMVVLLVICISIITLYAWHKNKINYTSVIADEIQQTTPPIEKVRVASYNIKTLNGGTTLQEAVKDLRELQADIVCLQEVDRKAFRSNNMDMVEEIANETGYEYHYYFPSMWLLDGYYGLGILSKYPIKEVTSKQLPTQLLEEPRILAKALVALPNRDLHVYNTHLSFRNREDRRSQITFIENNIEIENSILIGDFNTFTLDDFFTLPSMQSISDTQYQHISFMDFGFPDNIYYSEQFIKESAGVIPTSFSDHNMLYVDLLLNS